MSPEMPGGLEWLVFLPPLLAIVLAAFTRDVLAALLAALLVSETLISGFNPGAGFLAAVERSVSTLSDPGNARVLMFCLGVGALLALVRDGGGVAAFVNALAASAVAGGRRRVMALPALIGVAVFIETNLSLLASGVVARDLFDDKKLSRARLAYIIDSTSSPVSVLILLNGWGAYVLALLAPYELADPAATLVATIPLNVYALATMALVAFTILSDRSFGPMRASDARAVRAPATGPLSGYDAPAAAATQPLSEPGAVMNQAAGPAAPEPSHPAYMIVPLAVMIFGILAFLAWTGKGNLLAGSGSQSVLWSVTLAVLVAAVMLRFGRGWRLNALSHTALKGLSELLPAVTILFFSIALGASLKALGVGGVVAGAVDGALPAALLPAAVFLATGVMSFATGSSWGSYAIMVPIGVPLALALGAPPSLVLAAVLGGGVFGDHCSPISDTTVIASLAAGVDHLEHVRTQLPYALAAGAFAVVAYVALGLVLT